MNCYCGAYIKSTSSGGGNAQKICAQFKRNVKIQVGLEFFVLQGHKCFKFAKSETFGDFHYHCDGISTFSGNRITWIYLAEHNITVRCIPEMEGEVVGLECCTWDPTVSISVGRNSSFGEMIRTHSLTHFQGW